MGQDSTEFGIPLEPLRPALFAFPIDDSVFWFVREEIAILQSRYGKTLGEAVEIVNQMHNRTTGVTEDSWTLHESPLHWVRKRMEGPRYWERDPDVTSQHP